MIERRVNPMNDQSLNKPGGTPGKQMNPPPSSGIVTFLFTDIEGSTPLWERYPREMGESVATHNAILYQVAAENQGYVMKTFGDEFQIAFVLPEQALQAAIAAQRGLRDTQWGVTGPLKARMGIHTGQVELDQQTPVGTDYVVSHTLNRTARIRTAGHGGQILISLTVAELLRGRLPEGVSLLDLNEHFFKGLLQPEHIFQVMVADLPGEFPPLKSEIAPSHNLPIQLSSFIGRQKEINEVRGLLAHARLVTLIGAGGVGKTRLELRVAEDLLAELADGVWFINLAFQSEPDQVPLTTAHVLGLREEVGSSIEQVIVKHLASKQLLLVMDNCEHLIEAVARLLDRLLRSCPGVHILASSREDLGIEGEAIYYVPSLEVPEGFSTEHIASLMEFDAVKLFVERASTDHQHFALDETNAPYVVQICRRLDGIPLALELAAARVKVMGVSQIASRLDDCFRVLSTGSRTALPRHKTLRAAIDWSYNLLSEPERILFRRLAVFTGGWTLTAVEGICPDNLLGQDDLLDLLSQLVMKSLVVVEESESSGSRYRLLETIHQYAQEKLNEAGELEQIRQSHFNYFLEAAERNEQELHSALQLKAFIWIAVEQHNLKAALDWAKAGSPVHDAAGAQRLSAVMHLDFHQHGTHRLGKNPTAF